MNTSAWTNGVWGFKRIWTCNSRAQMLGCANMGAKWVLNCKNALKISARLSLFFIV